MDPPTQSRAAKLYAEILVDLQGVKSTEGVARDAVLLRISKRVGELAEIAENAGQKGRAVGNEGPVQRKAIMLWLMRISLELLKILGSADFYRLPQGSRRFDVGGHRTYAWAGHEAHSPGVWLLAA